MSYPGLVLGVGAQPHAPTKIKTTAKAHGVFVSADSGEMVYVDPNHEDERHFAPLLTPKEAKEAHMRGLIEDYDVEQDAVKNDVDDSRLPIDPNDLRTVGAERTAQFAGEDHESGDGSSTLDSRQSTAWEDRERVEGGTGGDGADASGNPAGARAPADEDEDSDIDRDSGDDDAPPAPAPKVTRKAKAAS